MTIFSPTSSHTRPDSQSWDDDGTLHLAFNGAIRASVTRGGDIRLTIRADGQAPQQLAFNAAKADLLSPRSYTETGSRLQIEGPLGRRKVDCPSLPREVATYLLAAARKQAQPS